MTNTRRDYKTVPDSDWNVANNLSSYSRETGVQGNISMVKNPHCLISVFGLKGSCF